MPKALIKIIYKQIIDSNSKGSFEKNIFNASYNEFLLKSQAYNPEKKFKTFSELKINDGRANSLHYKSGFAIGGFIDKLNKRIPVLENSLEENIVFETYRFEVIESDITDKTGHKVGINYITDTLTLYNIIGDYMLLSTNDKKNPSDSVETFLLKVQNGLSLTNYQEL